MQSPQRIPNMGWLEIKHSKSSPLLNNLEDARFYFAHSYHVQPEDRDDILMTADYGYPYAVALEKQNILGVQFHPEKSHRFGMQLLKNFAEKY
jgi:glutamine amidotransferase